MNTNVNGVVGPCAAGKSTLVAGLKARGYKVMHIAQEHSYVSDMWQRFAKPDRLIYLDVSYLVTLERQNLNWTLSEYQEQVNRLAHAHTHADFYLRTDNLSADEVLQKVLSFIDNADSS